MAGNVAGSTWCGTLSEHGRRVRCGRRPSGRAGDDDAGSDDEDHAHQERHPTDAPDGAGTGVGAERKPGRVSADIV